MTLAINDSELMTADEMAERLAEVQRRMKFDTALIEIDKEQYEIPMPVFQLIEKLTIQAGLKR